MVEGGEGGGSTPLSGKKVTLLARDGPLDDTVDAAVLLPSDLLKSMLPEDRECVCAVCARTWVCIPALLRLYTYTPCDGCSVLWVGG
jgi:hypothetical protein